MPLQGLGRHRWKLDPSCVLYLPLYELDGASFRSKDKHGHLCTKTGAFWTPQGWYFDPTDDKIVVPHHTALNGGAGLTVAIWYKSDDLTANRQFLCKNDAATLTNSYIFRYNSVGTTLQFRLNDGVTTGNTQPAAGMSVGIWYLLMGIKDGTSISVLKNGANLETTANAGLGSVTVVGALWVGGDPRNGVGEMAGIGGEAWVWGRALTLAEGRQVYRMTKWRYE